MVASIYPLSYLLLYIFDGSVVHIFHIDPPRLNRHVRKGLLDAGVPLDLPNKKSADNSQEGEQNGSVPVQVKAGEEEAEETEVEDEEDEDEEIAQAMRRPQGESTMNPGSGHGDDMDDFNIDQEWVAEEQVR